MTTRAGRFGFALCADDYAMTPGVSRGILEALDAGRLSATSVMTTSPWWPDLSGPLRQHIGPSETGRADIGLHLNLTLGAPLGAMPYLAPDGTLPDIAAWMKLARRGALPPPEAAELSAEIERQMQRFVDVFGRPPDHVDGHQHVHVLGPVAPLVLGAIKRRGWRPWLRDSGDRLPRILARGSSLKKALGLAVLARGFAGRARDAGLAVNDGFAGFSDFDPARDYSGQFARYLRAPGLAHLVMCHPGYADDALRALDPVVETREQELRFLLSPAFEALLGERGAQLRRLGTEN